MTSPMFKLWEHIENCDRCSSVDLDLCPDGERIQRESFDALAKRIAPMPDPSKVVKA